MANPIRSCVICRTKAEKSSLHRYIWDGSEPLLDKAQRMSGRGAYCCAGKGCGSKFLALKNMWRKTYRK